jgi:hypothetical protein
MQLRELSEHAFRRGWSVAKEYVDQGFSGSKGLRHRSALPSAIIPLKRKRRLKGSIPEPSLANGNRQQDDADGIRTLWHAQIPQRLKDRAQGRQ